MEEDAIVDQERLPHDLIAENILTRLPIKSLLQWKCVSNQWYSSLSSYHFATTHFKLSPFSFSSPHTQFLFIQNTNTYYILYNNDDADADDIGGITNNSNNNLMKLWCDFDNDEVDLIGSCNGLVCLASKAGYYFILWNPITGKFHKYFDPDFLANASSCCRVSWGFGYVSSIDDYKVVRILELPATLEIKVHVFSSKSNKWTRIADELYQDIISLRTTKYKVYESFGGAGIPFSFHSRRGILVNETLYWIVSETHIWRRKIVAFDLVLEIFDTMFDLEVVSTEVYKDCFLCVMGGCLSKCGINMRGDVYVKMLKGPGEKESIRLSRDLSLESCRDFVGFTRTGKFFILLEDSTTGIVDRSSQLVKYTPLLTFERSRKTHVASYVPSLILPHNVG